jgi:hypothetical protein
MAPERFSEAGFYESPWGGKFPRIQLLTVGELLDGKSVDYPHMTGGNVTHRPHESRWGVLVYGHTLAPCSSQEMPVGFGVHPSEGLGATPSRSTG